MPQGGNTGLVGGGVPLAGEAVLSLRRLSGITDVDSRAGQLTAGAGTSVAEVQAAAVAAGWAYGVDLGSRDSATVGGTVATNAGGLQVLRHGATRAQLTGVEAVLGTGAVVSHLGGLLKDNTGYDLAGLLCGSEGTLGVVTAARLRLVPPSPERVVALLAFSSTRRCGGRSVPPPPIPVRSAVARAVPARRPRAGLSGDRSTAPVPRLPPGVPTGRGGRADRPDAGHGRGARLGALRGRRGGRHRLDPAGPVVALPGGPHRSHQHAWALRTSSTSPCRPPALAAFIDRVPGVVAEADPDATTWLFGHAADGNIHVNITGVAADDLTVDGRVLTYAAALGGSISAEHGIGTAKRPWLHLNRSEAEIAAFRSIKGALDPAGILNPNVLLPPA